MLTGKEKKTNNSILMTKFKDINKLYYFIALSFGLITAQVIAAVHVYTSNTELLAKLAYIQNAGYLAIPNQHVMSSLQSIKPALLGGLFFTLSIGTGLGLIALAAAWFWNRIANRRKIIFLLYLILWAAMMVLVNSRGVNVFLTLHVVCIPLIVFITAIRFMPQKTQPSSPRNKIVHWVAILLLIFFWATQADLNIFIDLRDSLLLSNPIGKSLSNFYYRNTLYPAEAFKSLDQKMLKTCTLKTNGQEHVRRRLENKLLANDYLPIPDNQAADLDIVQHGNLLYFKYDDNKIVEVPVEDFFSHPAKILSAFSQSIDRNIVFRKIVFLSLWIGFPIAFFIITHSLMTGLLLFLAYEKASLCATVLFLFIGLSLLIPLHVYRIDQITTDNLDKALNSEKRHRRIKALKIISLAKMDISQFTAYPKLLENSDAAERYWLARALGQSRSSDAYNHLLAFLNDPQINVRTMAFFALGQQKNFNAEEIILDRIRNSHDWYDQWYAYKALRSLGWKQTKSQ